MSLGPFDANESIRLVLCRCWDCGRFWAHEPARNGTCPVCAAEKVRQAKDRVETLERSNASLRGVVGREKAKSAAERERLLKQIEGLS